MSLIDKNSDKNKFKKGTWKNHPFEDPTYLSFVLMFDWNGSSSHLFNGDAADFLEHTFGEVKRANDLRKFTKYFRRINMEMPWFWTSVEGLEKAFQYKKFEDGFRGGDDSKLTIGSLETMDLTISGVLDLYFNVVYDLKRWVEVLPSNLQYFDMYVLVSECRNIQMYKDNTSLKAHSDGVAQARDYDPANHEIGGDVAPHYMIKFKKCKFDIESLSDMFAGLSNKEPKAIEEIKFDIKYQIIEYYSKQYLNAFNGVLDENSIKGTNSPGLEKGPGDNMFSSNPDDPKPGWDRIKENVTNKLDGIKSDFADLTDRERIMEQLMAEADGLGNRLTQDAFGKLLLGNVYGLNAASNIQDALSSGSLNGVRNLLVKTVKSLLNDKGDGVNLGNVFPPTFGETPLGTDNIFPETQTKTPLSPENIRPETKQEQDLASTNVFPPKQGETPLESTKAWDSAEEESPLTSTKAWDSPPPEQDGDLGNIYDNG